jgi:hypothetical protein
LEKDLASHMIRPKSRTPHTGTSRRLSTTSCVPLLSRSDFYREEFLKHRRCLRRQREFFSDRAISEVDCALGRILSQLDQLCCQEDVDRLVSEMLKQFDVVTGLSSRGEQKNLH